MGNRPSKEFLKALFDRFPGSYMHAKTSYVFPDVTMDGCLVLDCDTQNVARIFNNIGPAQSFAEVEEILRGEHDDELLLVAKFLLASA